MGDAWLTTCGTANCAVDCSIPSSVCDTALTTQNAACDECLGNNCCPEVHGCLDDADCAACILDNTGAGCETNSLCTSLDHCWATNCDGVCNAQ